MFDSLMNIAVSTDTTYGNENIAPSVPTQIYKENTSLVPQDFYADIMALTQRFGILSRGMKLELELHEALGIMPRRRERSDAYRRLQDYLMKEKGIILTIKSSRINGKKKED